MSVSINGIIFDLILFLIIAGNAIFGYRVGLARVFCKLVSTVAAIILVLILYKPVTNYVINNTNITEKLETVVSEKIGYLFEKEEVDISNSESIENSDNISGLLKVFLGNKIGTTMENTKNTLVEYVSNEITDKIIRIVIALILFAIIRLILYVLRSYIEAIASIPVIRVFNGIGGMIYGVLKGFLIIYIVLAILSIILPILGNNIIIEAMNDSMIGSQMFSNNILLNILFRK